MEAVPYYPSDGSPPPGRRRRIGETLVAAGVLTEQQLDDCLAAQAEQPPTTRQRLGTLVVERGLASEHDIASGLARTLGLERVDLDVRPVSATAARLVPHLMSERYNVLGLELDEDRLVLAMADPTDVVALDDIKLATNVRAISVVVATATAIREHLNRVWRLDEGDGDVAGMLGDLGALAPLLDEVGDAAAVNDTPVVRLVNVILSDAVRARASDIHLQPELDGVRVRYRVDGLLRDVMTVPRTAQAAMTSRVKIISGLDIAERRRPQDGRVRLDVDGEQIDARVSTLPSMHGEKVVVRILSRSEGVLPLSRIGMSDPQLEIVLQTLVNPQGLVLITGPTGSGKTSTLYSSVSQMRTPDRNIVTLEDPVEMQLRGITQVQTNERAGLTFAAGLRSVLRQDPDVVLVGEIRDHETAELALRASLTGHLVFSTLHTNDAAAAMTRLVDMGVEPFLIASSLSLVVAQRLVRAPCPTCVQPYQPSPRTLQLLGLAESDLDGAELRRGRGCDRCGHTGYLGRTATFEVLPVDAAMRAVLTTQPTESAIRAAARATGVPSLRADGVAKALRGETTLEEVLRVTQADAASGPRCGSCQRTLEDDMHYCPWCAVGVERHACRSCGRNLEFGWRACPRCGESCEAVAPAPPAAGSGVPDRHEEPARPLLLVVDDDPSVAQFATVVLEELGEVVAVGTAEEALRVAATRDVSAMVLDANLPDLSGIEVTRLLRADTRTALMPILMLTGTTDPQLKNEAFHAGADDYLAKPVEPELLLDRIAQLVARAPQPAQ